MHPRATTSKHLHPHASIIHNMSQTHVSTIGLPYLKVKGTKRGHTKDKYKVSDKGEIKRHTLEKKRV